MSSELKMFNAALEKALAAENDRLRALNAELMTILQRLIEASDKQVGALVTIEQARAVLAREYIAKAKGET